MASAATGASGGRGWVAARGQARAVPQLFWRESNKAWHKGTGLQRLCNVGEARGACTVSAISAGCKRRLSKKWLGAGWRSERVVAVGAAAPPPAKSGARLVSAGAVAAGGRGRAGGKEEGRNQTSKLELVQRERMGCWLYRLCAPARGPGGPPARRASESCLKWHKTGAAAGARGAPPVPQLPCSFTTGTWPAPTHLRTAQRRAPRTGPAACRASAGPCTTAQRGAAAGMCEQERPQAWSAGVGTAASACADCLACRASCQPQGSTARSQPALHAPTQPPDHQPTKPAPT